MASAGRSYDDDLIRELIFTFQGIEGSMLRKSRYEILSFFPRLHNSFYFGQFQSFGVLEFFSCKPTHSTEKWKNCSSL